MAKTKISALTTLADGSIAIGDLIPIVDIDDTSQAASGTTKKVTITSLASAVATAFSSDAATFTNLTATGTLGVTGVATFTDNIAMASGKGIDFSANANASGMTSELLNDYEEGTWTPVLTANTSGTITITSPTDSLNYTKIGRLVTLTGRITIASVASPLGLLILNGFPFTSGASVSKNSGAGVVYADAATTASALSFRIAETAVGGVIATPNQGDAAPIMQSGTNLYINIAYTV